MPRRLWHTVTTAITPSLAVGTVCQSPQGTRGAYISTNSQIYNLQSKIEPTAAAVAYTTVVLTQFYCHCDRYWPRLTQCTVGAQASKSQPLPYRCPMDRIMNIAEWYGDLNTRARRGNCKAFNRADGRTNEGFPFRPTAWLEELKVQRREVSTAVLRPQDFSTPSPPAGSLIQALPLHTLPNQLDPIADELQGTRFSPPINGAAFDDRGPEIHVPSNVSDADLRQVFQLHSRRMDFYHRHGFYMSHYMTQQSS